MTTEIKNPNQEYTIAGTGPYAITWPYGTGTIVAVVVKAGVRYVLPGGDFSVSPAESATTGDLTLSAGAAATYAGGQLFISRATPAQQGWGGYLGAREKGLEAQLDLIVRAMQEFQGAISRGLRLDNPSATLAPVAGGVVGFSAELEPTVLTAWTPEGAEIVAAWIAANLFPAADPAEFLAALGITFDPAEFNAATAAGLTLLQAASVAAQRTALNVSLRQFNKLDTTAGSGLIVGAFGLGDIAYEITDWNTVTVTGAYKSTATTANGPDTASWQGVHIAVGTTVSNEYAVQIVWKLSSDQMWMRRRQAGTWSSWINLTPLGVGQTWQNMTASRAANTSYQNTSGRPIQVFVQADTVQTFQVSADNSTWLTLASFDYVGRVNVIIPAGHYYKTTGAFIRWAELF